jgi:hypothetical protein
MTCQTSVPNLQNLSGVGKVIIRFIEEAMSKPCTGNNPDCHINGQSVEHGIGKTFIAKDPLHDNITEEEGGCKEKAVPSYCERTDPEYLGIDIPWNNK